MPRHVAVIMDGNGRWARERGLSHLEGHRAGRQSIRESVEACGELGIAYLTLYTFSAENWRRPQAEVQALMMLIEEALRAELDELNAKDVRVRGLGRKQELAQSLQQEIARYLQLGGIRLPQ